MSRVGATVLLLVVLLAPLQAQDKVPPDVVVALFGTGGPSPFHNVIARSLVLELTRSGFNAERATNAGDTIPAGGARGMARIAAGFSAPLALSAIYSLRGNEITIKIEGVQVEGARVISSTERTTRIDLALDETLTSAVREVMPAMLPARDKHRQQHPQPVAAAPAAPGAAPGAPAAAAGTAPAGAPQPAPGASPDAPGAPVQTAGPVSPAAGAVPGAPAREPEAPGSRFQPLPQRGAEIAFGAAPLVPAGDLAVFLGTGASVAAHTELQWRHPGYRLGLGVGAGAIVFGAEGPLSSAFGLLAPVTLEARYGGGDGDTGFYARAGVGGAFFRVDSEVVGVLQKFVPCATAAIGLTRRLSDTVGLAIDATYGIYLDSSDLIMGLAPGLQLFFVR